MELLKIKPKIKKNKNYRMGLVALATDFTIESDFNKVLPNDKIGFYVNIVFFALFIHLSI